MAALAFRELSSIRSFLALNGVRTSWASSLRQCHQNGQFTPPGSTGHNSQSSSSDSDGETSKNEKEYDKNISRQILAASLPFVPRCGWTKTALRAQTLGYAGISHGMFPQGGVELVNYFYIDCNERLVEKLRQDAASHPEGKAPDPQIIVCDAVEARLRMILPYLDRWSEAMVLLALPRSVPTSLANLLTLVDDICYYAGDRSVDVRWYSRRLGLATVYKMTELYFIQDTSEDHKATWKFLKQRVEEAVQLQHILHEAGITPKIALETINSTFDAARSILRLNR
ncbi:Ubiquinone biosynthesis protein COQ9, mitochondrial [Frankliniella fusca]|uniref:Ubiquinone biosynthesis protein n=1 Tax=Frankliniella fusca TaxID=407009 RepID=A0AAE1I3Q1_9NEOP|nr:Ubiquinone biosynthesis protein COQ9, mitochondrial [Frankliniella fusca]